MSYFSDNCVRACSASLPQAQTPISDLCKQRAAYFAHQSSCASCQTAEGMILLEFVLVILIMVLAWATAKIPPPSKRNEATVFLLATIFFMPMVVGLTIYVLTVQHTFYCMDDPEWRGWTEEWIIAALVPGLAALLAFADWLMIGMHFFATLERDSCRALRDEATLELFDIVRNGHNNLKPLHRYMEVVQGRE